MHQTIGRIAGKVTDYKKCKACQSINWYENEECHNCMNKRFKAMTEREGLRLLRDLEYDNLSDETEIDV